MDIILTEAKKVAITLLIIDIGIVIFTLATKMFNASVVIGIIYGFIFAELNFILLGTVVEKALSMDVKHAKRHMKVNYIMRFALLAVILAIPFISTKINGWCVVLAMLSPKFTYFAIGFIGLIPKKGGRD
ncbi:MAG: ATP synthase subunit I [Oscillospiraceae bacterium]